MEGHSINVFEARSRIKDNADLFGNFSLKSHTHKERDPSGEIFNLQVTFRLLLTKPDCIEPEPEDAGVIYETNEAFAAHEKKCKEQLQESATEILQHWNAVYRAASASENREVINELEILLLDISAAYQEVREVMMKILLTDGADDMSNIPTAFRNDTVRKHEKLDTLMVRLQSENEYPPHVPPVLNGVHRR